LNIAEAWPTPAVVVLVNGYTRRNYMSNRVWLTKLELSRPYSLGWVFDEVLGEVSLDTTDHIMTVALATLTDDTKGVVFHDGCSADASQKTLLHAALKFEDCNFWRGDFDFDGNFAECNPGGENAVRSSVKNVKSMRG
jgi:hypothetical protein